MAFIKVIEPEEAEGRLKEIYDDLLAKRGKLAEVHKIQSLNPESIVAHMDLYMRLMYSRSPIKRYQREMIAVVVSSTNNCEYCITHHAEALEFFWKDQAKTKQLSQDYNQVELSDTDRNLCQLAEQLTKNPSFKSKEALINQIKDLGVSERGILDATMIIAYFNFVNRIVLGLGVDLEGDGGSGYKYD